MTNFTCPKCDSPYFGAVNPLDEVWVYECHGNSSLGFSLYAGGVFVMEDEISGYRWNPAACGEVWSGMRISNWRGTREEYDQAHREKMVTT